ncbi:MAG: hypothetical protein ACRDZQ_07025, partial [Acidimicrobiales bacterium]
MGTGDRLLSALVADLARAESGLDFIYHALDRLVAHRELRDAIVVVEDPRIGRQVFRAGRRPPHETTVGYDPLEVAPGLYTDPELGADWLRDAVANLCQVGLQLDLSRHDASHDALTGLYNRRTFDA